MHRLFYALILFDHTSGPKKDLGTVMPVRPYLASQAFDPEIIAEMSAALEEVCEVLSLKMVDDAATRLVAEKIIELAQRGVRDVATLRAMTLEQLKQQ
jgi:hypothetical protein